MSFRLTDQHKAFFDTFGYLGFPGLVKDRVDEIIRGFEEVFAEHGEGNGRTRHDGTKRSCIPQFIDLHAGLSSLLDDPRILAITEGLLGEDFNYSGSDGNYYVGDTGWHSDGWDPRHLNIKLAFYLDPVTRDTGCLRVIPGSHKIGDGFAEAVQKQIGRSADTWGMHGRDVPCVPLETRPGDVLVFNHNLKHAAFGGNNRRRMFTMNCQQRYPQERLPELRKALEGAARFWLEQAYGDAMVRTASPRRMRHLEQIMANQDHLPELARKARQTMAEPARG